MLTPVMIFFNDLHVDAAAFQLFHQIISGFAAAHHDNTLCFCSNNSQIFQHHRKGICGSCYKESILFPDYKITVRRNGFSFPHNSTYQNLAFHNAIHII